MTTYMMMNGPCGDGDEDDDDDGYSCDDGVDSCDDLVRI